jgi:5-formyltetrahydrofolate cyclo-ligase
MRNKLTALLTPEYRQTSSYAASQALLQSKLITKAQHIGCYFALPHEMDTQIIITAIQQQQKYCYLPILAPDPKEKILRFGLYLAGARLQANRFNIYEPATSPIIVAATTLELIILPVLAFDNTGTRLGSGGGFYDQTLALLAHQKLRQPLLVGLAYSWQESHKLPKMSYDISLDYIVTEKAIQHCH